MSWDIYGEPLRRGYCEVHPHVAESYPCSLCDVDHQRMNFESKVMQQAEVDHHRAALRGYLVGEATGLLMNWKPTENLDIEAKARVIEILEQLKA